MLKTSCVNAGSVKDLIVLISYFPEHASGGRCFDKSVQIEETVDYNGREIKLTDKGVLFDNKIIKEGDSIQINRIQFKPKNIWWIYQNEFKLKNCGQIFGLIVNDSITKFEEPKYLVTGRDYTRENFNYAVAVIYLGIFIYLILLFIKLIKNKTCRPKNKIQ